MKNVIISIQGFQRVENKEEDKIELVTDGQYEKENGVAVFSYMESELTGLEGTKTTFTVDNDIVTLMREGTLNSRMLFEKGQKHFFMYELPFGSVTMGVSTNSIEADLGEKGGDLEIKYTVDMDNSVVSENTFRINVKEV